MDKLQVKLKNAVWISIVHAKRKKEDKMSDLDEILHVENTGRGNLLFKNKSYRSYLNF